MNPSIDSQMTAAEDDPERESLARLARCSTPSEALTRVVANSGAERVPGRVTAAFQSSV